MKSFRRYFEAPDEEKLIHGIRASVINLFFELIVVGIGINVIASFTALTLSMLGYLPIVNLREIPDRVYYLLTFADLMSAGILVFIHRWWRSVFR